MIRKIDLVNDNNIVTLLQIECIEQFVHIKSMARITTQNKAKWKENANTGGSYNQF